ncbi:IS982 family transposase [Polaromonas naphthalenivorans]|uniref:Transposase, IS4 family n=1 Tax=Polaromonas naphthalenivorans (strain CJ2) TaxID=365044 RepID=A1VUQ8_POLNA|nr:IS982 family transposase [Polaromonas naphthalenivorans]ABM39386.1 transposase, IS4 family [Polaromonas naphthalenivorans CJ2]
MDKTMELFCLIDDFCQQFEPLLEQRMLDSSGKQRRNRTGSMSLSEMTTIVVLFHTMRGRQFKEFYRGTVCRFMTSEFPRQLSYTRFVALMPRCAVVLAALFQTLKGTCTGISIADSTPLAVCHNLRINRHRVFQGIAQRGKSSTGWFYGFKLHAVINHQGELLAIKVTPGNIDDRKGLLTIASSLFGKLYADKGYIGKDFASKMKDKGIEVVTRVRKNMKEVVHSGFDQALLRKRSLVETVFDELKNLCQIEHTRHRSLMNFAVNLMAGIVAYCLQPVKPRIALRDSRGTLAVN